MTKLTRSSHKGLEVEVLQAKEAHMTSVYSDSYPPPSLYQREESPFWVSSVPGVGFRGDRFHLGPNFVRWFIL